MNFIKKSGNCISISGELVRIQFSNSIDDINHSQEEKWTTFAEPYTFFMEDTVDNVQEYVVDFDILKDMAMEYDLVLVLHSNFHKFLNKRKRK